MGVFGNRETIVFAAEHYNTLDLIRSLGVEGVSPIYIAVKGKSPCSTMSKYIKECHRVDSIEEGYEILLGLGGDAFDSRPLVYTADDKTQAYLDERYNELKDSFVFFNAGESGRITRFMDKFEILELAKRHGLKCLDTVVVERGSVPSGVSYPVITKSIAPIVGGWKSDVHICRSEQELADAFSSILSPDVVVQSYIEKKNEYCIDGFAADCGKLVFCGSSTTYNYNLDGYYSPYMTVVPFNDAGIQAALEGMMQEIGFEGIFSAEFLIDKDDNFYFTEINFRNSPWNYAMVGQGINVPFLWGKMMLGDVSCLDRIPRDFPPVKAMIEPVDYQKRVVEQGMPLESWVIELLDCGCLFYFDKDDLEPFFQMIRDNKVLR